MRSTKSPSWIERLLGLAPQPVPPHAFALEPDRLRYALVGRGAGRGAAAQALGGSRGLDEYHEEPLPPDLFPRNPLGGPTREVEKLRAAVERLLSRVATPVREASLVLPEAWFRLVSTEIGELPRTSERRDEMLRWKLRRLVPFRLEDLRVGHLEVRPLDRQEEPGRVLIGFGAEALIAQLEEVFASAGVRLGQVTHPALAALAAARPALGDGLAALLLVEPRGTTFLAVRDGEPLLHRHRAAAPSEEASSLGPPPDEQALRELRLVGTYLGEQLPGAPLERVLIVAPESVEVAWRDAAFAALQVPVDVAGRGHFGLRREGPPTPWRELVALVGATSEEFL